MLDVALAFHTAAALTEHHIVASGLSHADGSSIGGNSSRTKRDMWMGLKATSHFNLHQSFELFLKFILKLEGTEYGRPHGLAQLYDMLSPRSQDELDDAYQSSMAAMGPFREIGVAFYVGPKPPQLHDADITTVKDWFEYLDRSLKLHLRRYQWEDIGRGEPILYDTDMGPWFDMLDAMSRYAHKLFRESV